MTDYAFTGKKGTGKSKHAVIRIRDVYLKRGRRVASNLDLYLEPMFGPHSRVTYVRVPDKPTEFDLLAAGHGNPDDPYNEEKAGALVLDELGTWFNSRTFNDKGRAGTLDYLAHARKKGWDCYYIMQDIVQVDKQLRDSFIEQVARHTRFDKVRIPFVGQFLSLLFGERVGYLPRFHSAVFRVGTASTDLVSDRFMYRGNDIQPCYDTLQVFKADYPHGTHSVLSPWHVKGRYMDPVKPSIGERLVAWLRGFFVKPAPLPRRAPVAAPSPAVARVVKLASTLPPAQASRVLSRYFRALDAAAIGGAGAVRKGGPGAAEGSA